MMQDQSGMFAEERRQKILALLHQEKRVIAKELAERFEISIDSIRRDLTIMEEQGLLQKTHGGAIPSMKVRQPPQPWNYGMAKARRKGTPLPNLPSPIYAGKIRCLSAAVH